MDGWGSITTPFGTFSALRIKSTLTGQDSLYLDSLQQGFAAARPLTREYKWLANGNVIPVLEINTTETLGIEAITSIRYRDSIRTVGLNQISLLNAEPVLSPNPAGNHDVNALINLQQASQVDIVIQSMDGKVVSRQNLRLEAGMQNVLIKSTGSGLLSGLYTVSFIVGNERFTTKLVVN